MVSKIQLLNANVCHIGSKSQATTCSRLYCDCIQWCRITGSKASHKIYNL